MDVLKGDDTGAGGTFLPAEAEGGVDDRLCCKFKVRIGIDDDRVLAAISAMTRFRWVCPSWTTAAFS